MHRDGESIGQEARLHPGQDTHTPHTLTLTLEDWEKSMHIWKVYENSIWNPEQ